MRLQDHAVLECKSLSCGVVVQSAVMESLDRASRRARMEKALELKGVKAEEFSMRWYKKADAPGCLYVRLPTEETAQELIEEEVPLHLEKGHFDCLEVLLIGSEEAKVYPITKAQ